MHILGHSNTIDNNNGALHLIASCTTLHSNTATTVVESPYHPPSWLIRGNSAPQTPANKPVAYIVESPSHIKESPVSAGHMQQCGSQVQAARPAGPTAVGGQPAVC